MPNVFTISDGTDTYNGYDRSVGGLLDGNHDLGTAGVEGRVLKPRIALFSVLAQQTQAAAEANLAKLRKLFAKAERSNSLGNPRDVILTIQPAGLATPTIYYVTGGHVPEMAPWNNNYMVEHIYDEITLTINVEPWAYGPEVPLVSGGAAYGRPGIDVRFIATGATSTALDGTAVGDNTASLSYGSLAFNQILTLTPTSTTLAVGVAYYFGCTYSKFDALYLGIETAKTGTWTGVWELYNGSAWAAITTLSQFRSGAEATEFDTVRRVGSIALTGSLTSWAAKSITVDGVSTSAFWLRYRITAGSSGAAPVLINGPVRSAAGLIPITGASVTGDSEAGGLVHLANPSATALAAIKAAIITDEKSGGVPPPVYLPWTGARQFLPSGNITATATPDTNAVMRDAVDLNLVASITDRAQTFNGTTEYMTITPGAADKLAKIGESSFAIEILFNPTTVQNGPTCLFSQATIGSAALWCGYDQGNLRFIAWGGGGKRKSISGTTAVLPGQDVLATFVWNDSTDELSIMRDGLTEKTLAGMTSVMNGLTVAVRVGKSVGFDTAWSRSGSDAEQTFHGKMSNLRILKNTPELEHPTGYNWPLIGTAIRNDSATTRWLLKMQDNAASLTVTDFAITLAAAQSPSRNAGNTSTHTTIGYFQPGSGQKVRVLGDYIPPIWAEEYKGRVKFLLRCKPLAALGSLDDCIFQLQLNVGDIDLPMGPAARFPDVAVPANNGYYLLDLDVFPTPPVELRETGVLGTYTNAKNMMQVNLYVQHKFITATTIRVDCLIVLPTPTWQGEYRTFGEGGSYDTAFDIEQNAGVLFDSLGPRTVIGQTSTVGYADPFRNPYGDAGSARRVKLVPGKAAWLLAIPERGAVGTMASYTAHVVGDSLTPIVHSVGHHEALVPA